MTESPVALLTGAGSGIGEAIAQTLAKQGYQLLLCGRRRDALAAVRDTVMAATPELSPHAIRISPGDVCQAGQCQAWVTEALDAWGRVDVLVNNAGVAGKIGLLHEVDEATVHRILDTNVKGALFLMQAVLQQAMIPQSLNKTTGTSGNAPGTIININSIAGQEAFPYWAVYDASKFALRALTQAVAEEQRSNGIRVVGIHPGAVRTPIWDQLDLAQAPQWEHMLLPDDVARAVAYVLAQPPHVVVPELTITPVQPAL